MTYSTEEIATIRLYRTEHVGPITFFDLLKRYGNATAAIEALPDLSARGGRKKPLFAPHHHIIDAEIEKTLAYGASYVFFDHPSYPSFLKTINDPPPFLITKGDQTLLQKQTFAIVGSRNASIHGRKLAQNLAMEMGERGWVVASGLARGIDAAAHEGALETGTIAVIAGGIDYIYPPENAALYKDIAAQGLIVTESPIGIAPQANFFPKRNRIISGLSRGVLIVEAALQSGSLITGRYAVEQNRDVFAIPGHPFDPRAKGPNQLIKQGAILTENIDDIITQLNQYIIPKQAAPSLQEDDLSIPIQDRNYHQQIILQHTTFAPLAIDELAKECHLSAQQLWSLLLELELAGKILRLPGLKIVRLPDEER